MKKLPIGRQTFSELRLADELYIDKTEIALDLIDNYRYTFLSRPRRFGKSLFVTTLKEIFEGKREYFKDLYIYDKWDWEDKYPVIHIDFSKGRVEDRENLDSRFLQILKENQDNLGIECEYIDDSAGCFRELIVKSHKKYNKPVVVLIDEYDKPILDNIEKPEKSNSIRDGLYNLYSVLKGSDEYIKFVFITGVSRFSKTSIFSGLNMIEDITLTPTFGNICGYTQNDIETTLEPYLQGVDLEKLKKWYNGYNFLADKLYNPFNILLFIKNNFIYDNYWFSSGTPTFLIRLIEKKQYFLPKLSNLVVGKELLDSFDINRLRLEVVLFQTGYLTIAKSEIDMFEGIEYTLKIPNREVLIAFNNYILEYMTDTISLNSYKNGIYKALLAKDMEALKSAFVSMFASIPYNNYTKNSISKFEGFYATVVYTYFVSLGIEVITEDVTNHGRIDLTIRLDDAIFIVEFKVGKEDALKQIKDKNYAQKYLSNGRNIYLIGMNFDEEERNLCGFEWEKI